MTSTPSEIVARLTTDAEFLARKRGAYPTIGKDCAEAATLITTLVEANAELTAERDAAVGLVSSSEAERYRSCSELLERALTAERLLAEAVERAFRDGLAYGGNVENADPDVAWQHSKARSLLSTGGGNGR
jgi:hypothetical protein